MPANVNAGTPPKLTQANRPGKLFTPLAEDTLVLRRFEAVEGLSEQFEFRADALSETANIPLGPLLGQDFCAEFRRPTEPKRYFHGILTEAQWIGAFNEYFVYRLVIRPKMWLLSRQADCRIFKKQSVPDLVKLLVGGVGLQVESKLTGDYAVLDYCVQYRETDLAFVSRLMEEYGIYYYFTHTQGAHTFVMADSPSAHSPFGTLPYIPLSAGERRNEELIDSWTGETRLRTGKVSLADFDYLAPRRDLLTEKSAADGASAPYEIRDYPGRFNFHHADTSAGGDDQRAVLTGVKLESDQALRQRKFAAGDAVVLYPGAAFTLKGHSSDNGDYLVVRASHHYQAAEGRSGGGGGDTDDLPHGHYELQSKDVQFRAPQITPKPRIYGPQTAFVVDQQGKDASSSSEEIDVDLQGRIWVEFHWSRQFAKKTDPEATFSLPVRVAQMWSGSSWGWQVIPRIGQEVVVNFLEGDPDQPLVTGTVYNDAFKFPYKLPDNKTISGVKSDSTKGHNGFNEFYFEDKKSSEVVRLKAEKDRQTVVQNCEFREIWNFQTEEIGKNFKKGADGVASPDGFSRETTIYHGTDTLEVKDGDWQQIVNRNWLTQVDTGDVTLTVSKGDQQEEITEGNYQLAVKAGDMKVKTGKDVKFNAGANFNAKAGQSMHIKAGMSLIIEAGLQISLKVGGNFVDIGPAGVTITGTMVMINSGGAAGSGSGDFG